MAEEKKKLEAKKRKKIDPANMGVKLGGRMSSGGCNGNCQDCPNPLC